MSEGRPPDPDDPWSRLNYRRVIAWPERLVREEPLLSEIFGKTGSVLDLGCGTGEHSFLLASFGLEVTGLDLSEEQLRAARGTESHLTPRPRFLSGDLRALDEALGGSFGGALCLGNTLPNLQARAELDAFLRGLARHLAPGAPFLLQVLNYRRILERKVRALPVNVRPGEAEGEEIVFVRLMTPQPDGSLLFHPATLRYRPLADEPLELVTARTVRLHPWTLEELEPALAGAGFDVRERWGGMRKEAYAAADSPDLVLLAVRRT